MAEPIIIRCPCGGVTLTLSAPPVTQFFCHCRDCRIVHGAAYTLEAMVRAGDIRLEGETRVFMPCGRRRERFARLAASG